MADKKNEIAEEMPEESLEELFAKLDQVAKELESGDTSLEESFGLYQKGMEMLSYTLRHRFFLDFFQRIPRSSLWQRGI